MPLTCDSGWSATPDSQRARSPKNGPLKIWLSRRGHRFLTHAVGRRSPIPKADPAAGRPAGCGRAGSGSCSGGRTQSDARVDRIPRRDRADLLEVRHERAACRVRPMLHRSARPDCATRRHAWPRCPGRPDLRRPRPDRHQSRASGLREALAACRAGDTLVVTKLDLLVRSLPDARAIAADRVTVAHRFDPRPHETMASAHGAPLRSEMTAIRWPGPNAPVPAEFESARITGSGLSEER